jgi:DNA-binding MarR family transcriptional regulator
MLVRIERDATTTPDALARAHEVSAEALTTALAGLRHRGLVAELSSGNGARPRLAVTPAGCEVLGRIAAARRARLGELLADWPAARREELAALLRRLAFDLVPEPHPTAPAPGITAAG